MREKLFSIKNIQLYILIKKLQKGFTIILRIKIFFSTTPDFDKKV
jgi:hypothetical protein